MYLSIAEDGAGATAAVCVLEPRPEPPVLTTLKGWLGSWSGIGAVIAGMTRQGFNIELRQFPEWWRANFYPAGTGPLGSLRLGLGEDPRECGPAGGMGGVEQGLTRRAQSPANLPRAGRRVLRRERRYHFISLGHLVPYLEVSGAPGATDLRVREQNTNFVFLLFAGAGASYFVSDRVAIYAGYRLQHISNAGTSTPNQGINSHTGVLGVSLFFR